MSHANARLTLFGRKLLVDRVAAGHKPAEVAKQLGVSRQTVYKWVRRYRAEGLAGLVERSSRPHRMPRALSPAAAARIRAARLAEHAGPVRLATLLELPASTIGRVIAREGLPRLADIDQLTGEVVRSSRRSDRRYEHHRPGDLLHIDVKKLGRIPAGGGWRVHGRSNRAGGVQGRPQGWDYIHVAVDDHTRLAYAPRSCPTRSKPAARSSCTGPSAGCLSRVSWCAGY